MSTERRSFSGERPSESKVRVLHAWRSMVQEENESHPAIIGGSHSTPVTVRPYIGIVIVMHCLMHIF